MHAPEDVQDEVPAEGEQDRGALHFRARSDRQLARQAVGDCVPFLLLGDTLHCRVREVTEPSQLLQHADG